MALGSKTTTKTCNLNNLYDLYDALRALKSSAGKEREMFAASATIFALLAIAGGGLAAAIAGLGTVFGANYWSNIKSDVNNSLAKVDEFSMFLEENSDAYKAVRVECVGSTCVANGVTYWLFEDLKITAVQTIDGKWIYQ